MVPKDVEEDWDDGDWADDDDEDWDDDGDEDWDDEDAYNDGYFEEES